MKRASTSLAVLACAAVVGSTELARPAAGSPTTPPGSHIVSGAALSDLRAKVTLQAGDPTWLIYSAADVDATGTANPATSKLYARSSTGKVRSLGADNHTSYRVAGDTLSSPAGIRVKVWNLATGAHRVLGIPHDASYLGAAPGGFLFSRAGHEYLETYRGHATRLGTAFPGYQPRDGVDQPESAVASQKDAVFTTVDGAAVRYTFATKKLTALNTHGLAPGALEGCTAILSGHVACISKTDGAARQHRYFDLLSLTGAPAHHVLSPTAAIGPALTARGLTWISTSGRLTTLTPEGKQVSGSSHHVLRSLASAYGSAVFTRARQTEVALTAGAGQVVHTVTTAPRSHVEVSAYALGGGRLAWRDDSGPKGADVLRVAKIAKASVSGARRITATLGIQALGVSASTLAFGAVKDGKSGLQIMSNKHSTFIAGIKDPIVGVSGHRVLYFRDTGPRLVTSRVYDAATGETTTVAGSLLDETAGIAAAISGHRVAYQKKDASVWVSDLNTKHATQVRPPSSNGSAPRVSFSGNYVAWGFRHQLQYRNVATMAPAMSVDLDSGGLLRGMTDHGVIVERQFDGALQDYSLVKIGDTAGPQFLRTSGGAPQISASTVTWRDATHALRVADAKGLNGASSRT